LKGACTVILTANADNGYTPDIPQSIVHAMPPEASTLPMRDDNADGVLPLDLPGPLPIRERATSQPEDTSDPEIDATVARAREAQRLIESWSEARIDALLLDLAQTVAARAEALSIATVRETKLGNVPDKITTHHLASLGVVEALIGKPGNGVIRMDTVRQITEVASPVGVVFGVVPMTNPVATAVFKALINIKARNALIVSFPHTCATLAAMTGDLIHEVLARHGAPPDLVQCLKDRTNRKQTAQFMMHDDVALILATGGAGIVKAAYRSGTPALGVGPGNTPALIAADAFLDAAGQAIVASKAFDNGIVCGVEHNLVVVAAARERLCAALERAGAAVLTAEERAQFNARVIRSDGRYFRRQVFGQSAAFIAEFAGITRPFPIKIIIVPTAMDEDGPYRREKLAPILSLFTVPDSDTGVRLCKDLLAHEGAGHTAILHSTDPTLIERFGREMPVSRVLVNSPGLHGLCGVTSGLPVSFSLGCGTWGGNSTTDNISYMNVLNIKRIAQYLPPRPGTALAAAADACPADMGVAASGGE
jgi:acetaldehyde dehydrogenase / alcohol dehydrogenase